MLDPYAPTPANKDTKQVLHRDLGMPNSLMTPPVVSTLSVAEWKEILPPVNVSEVMSALNKSMMIEAVNPTEEEVTYALGEFKRLGLSDVTKVDYEKVSTIAKQQFVNLNNNLKKFTTQLTSVQTPGMFGLVDELSKDIKDTDYPAIWAKAVNAKPTRWARFLNVFNNKSSNDSLNNHFNSLSELVSTKGKNLETKLTAIEKQLIIQRNEQLLNIKTLQTSFDMYLETFIDLRKQFIVVVFLEHYYDSYVKQLAQHTTQNTDLILANEFDSAKEVLRDIGDKRAIMHKSLLQLPMTAHQSKNMITVCKNLLKEIDNTVDYGFPIIRSNLSSLGVGLRTQQAMLTNRSAQDLEHNTSMMAAEVAGDLAVRGELLGSESRLREAQNIALLVDKIVEVERRLSDAKSTSANNLEEAKTSLLRTTALTKEVLNQNLIG